MSLLSKWTGIGISKKGIKINPKQVLKAGLIGAGGLGAIGLAGLGGFGSAAGAGGKLGLLKGVGGFLSKHKKDIVDYGALGEGVYDRMQENKASGQMNDRYRALQPYRDQAMQQLMAPTPSTAGIFTEQPTQPGRYRRVGSGGSY